MKLIFFLLIIILFPFSPSHSEAVKTSHVFHLKQDKEQVFLPIKKGKRSVKKKAKKNKIKRKNKRSRIIKKVQDKAPGFAVMLIGGILLLVLAIFLMGSAPFALSGLAAALTFFFGLLMGVPASIVIFIAAVFLAKGFRENKSFYELHGKSEKELKKELAAGTAQKFPRLNNSEVKTYNRYQVKVHKLEAIIALKEKRKFAYTKRIKRLQKDKNHYQGRIEQLEKQNLSKQNHQLEGKE